MDEAEKSIRDDNKDRVTSTRLALYGKLKSGWGEGGGVGIYSHF